MPTTIEPVTSPSPMKEAGSRDDALTASHKESPASRMRTRTIRSHVATLPAKQLLSGILAIPSSTITAVPPSIGPRMEGPSGRPAALMLSVHAQICSLFLAW